MSDHTITFTDDEHTRLLGWAYVIADLGGWDDLDEAVSEKLSPPPACPTCGSEDPTRTGRQAYMVCPDPFHGGRNA